MFNFESVKESNVIAPSKRREGCEFIGMKRIVEDQSVVFDFREKATNATLSHREFVPSRMENQTDDDYKKSITMSVGRIAHIYRAFSTEAEFLAIKVEDPNNLNKAKENWVAITAMVGKSLKAKVEARQDMTCALKITLRGNKGKYYSALPQVPPFISTVNHHKDFTWNQQYDMLEAPAFSPDAAKGAAPKQEGTTASAFAGATGAAGGDNPDF